MPSLIPVAFRNKALCSCLSVSKVLHAHMFKPQTLRGHLIQPAIHASSNSEGAHAWYR